MSQFPQTQRVELEYGTDSSVMVSFFNMVYAWMAVGLAVTAAVSWYVSKNDALLSIFAGGGTLFTVFIFLAMFGIAMLVQTAALKISAGLGTLLFMVYATLMGALLAPIYIIYDVKTIGAAFALTGGVFAVMSVIGFITKKDLTKLGMILTMALVGLILASFVNLFFFSADGILSWAVTYGILAVFIGLTAYQTQMLKNTAMQLRDQPDLLQRYAIIGSLVLYIAFINMFMAILRILGDRR